MLHNSLYWWFFLFQGNQWTKYHTEAKTLPADVCVFSHFGRLSPAAVHSADWRFDSGTRWWTHALFIVTYLCKNFFFLHWNSCKQCFESLLFLIDCEQTQQPLLTQLSHCQMFKQNGEHTAFWYLHFFCYLTQLQFTISQNGLWNFLVFSEPTAKFGRPECSVSFVSVWPRLKSAYHLLTIVSNGAESK